MRKQTAGCTDWENANPPVCFPSCVLVKHETSLTTDLVSPQSSPTANRPHSLICAATPQSGNPESTPKPPSPSPSLDFPPSSSPHPFIHHIKRTRSREALLPTTRTSPTTEINLHPLRLSPRLLHSEIRHKRNVITGEMEVGKPRDPLEILWVDLP